MVISPGCSETDGYPGHGFVDTHSVGAMASTSTPAPFGTAPTPTAEGRLNPLWKTHTESYHMCCVSKTVAVRFLQRTH